MKFPAVEKLPLHLKIEFSSYFISAVPIIWTLTLVTETCSCSIVIITKIFYIIVIVARRCDFHIIHHLSPALIPKFTCTHTHTHTGDDDNDDYENPFELNDRVRSIFGRSHTHTYIYTYVRRTRGTTLSLPRKRSRAKNNGAVLQRRHGGVFKLSRSIHSRQRQTELRLIFLVVLPPPIAHAVINHKPSYRRLLCLFFGRRPIGS